MGATLITVVKLGQFDTYIKIKVNEGCPVPRDLITDGIQSFRTWQIDNSHLFVWRNDKRQDMSVIVPQSSIGWITSAKAIGTEESHFNINSPCEVTVEEEVTV